MKNKNKLTGDKFKVRIAPSCMSNLVCNKNKIKINIQKLTLCKQDNKLGSLMCRKAASVLKFDELSKEKYRVVGWKCERQNLAAN